ncbi:MAG: glycolate oxidase [Caldibacillus debilis]|uniref:Glycolate oxidase iron-sulfur subunit n=1 Tax=Caldibacillus debilis TaxID=301148 RepID=A0A3E0K436_9BACI|nr:(Fe-S)-binding protein [Caldibacillus debilis]REJ28386.1 MAG: glycolate oxidase [Caldibacillus debilis]
MSSLTKQRSVQQDFREKMDEDELLNCMRCGFCLPACPTYIETGKEYYSPRGRIALMKAVRDGMIDAYEEVEHTLNVCLGCRACEPVCPAGVKYGHLLEEARHIFEQHKARSLPVKAVRKTVFEGLFPHQSRMQAATSLVGFYQRSGLQKVARKIGFLKLFPKTMAEMEKILPDVPKKKEMKGRRRHFPPIGEKKATVAFFAGCLMDTLFLKTNENTIRLLQLAGCEVVVPENQGCCGALHGHSGEKEKAKELAKRNIEAFEQTDADHIVLNAGGCGGYLVDYDHLLKDEKDWRERAKRFKNKVKDMTEILVELEFHKNVPLHLPGQILTYQDSCHLRNVMGVHDAPRKLLQAIEGAAFVELDGADKCCGSAGIYNILQPEMANQILDHKMEKVKMTNACTIVTTNPGCLMQMKMGIERHGLSGTMRAVHIADLLMEASVEKGNMGLQ